MLNESKFVTAELLNRVFARLKDEWTLKYITKVKGRVAAVIIVLDPAYQFEENPEPLKLWTGILGEQDPSKWQEDRPYHKFAMAKAVAAWRTKMHNHEMLMNPELIRKGDFKYEGGIYTAGGLVIATSGLEKATDDTTVSFEFAREIGTEARKLLQESLADNKIFYF